MWSGRLADNRVFHPMRCGLSRSGRHGEPEGRQMDALETIIGDLRKTN
jgi:hypothetical protein